MLGSILAALRFVFLVTSSGETHIHNPGQIIENNHVQKVEEYFYQSQLFCK